MPSALLIFGEANFDGQRGDVSNESRFKDIERVASGGTATIYKATDTKLRRVVALRRVGLSAGGAEQTVAHARGMAAVPPHSNVVTVHEVIEVVLPGEDDLSAVSVMEFVHGKPLASVLKTAQTAAFAKQISEGILDGIGHFHSHGRAHMDLHTDNVLVDNMGTVKIADPQILVTQYVSNPEHLRSLQAKDVQYARELIVQILRHSDLETEVAATFGELTIHTTSVEQLRQMYGKAVTPNRSESRFRRQFALIAIGVAGIVGVAWAIAWALSTQPAAPEIKSETYGSTPFAYLAPQPAALSEPISLIIWNHNDEVLSGVLIQQWDTASTPRGKFAGQPIDAGIIGPRDHRDIGIVLRPEVGSHLYTFQIASDHGTVYQRLWLRPSKDGKYWAHRFDVFIPCPLLPVPGGPIFNCELYNRMDWSDGSFGD